MSCDIAFLRIASSRLYASRFCADDLLVWAYSLLGAAVLLPLFTGVKPAVAVLIARASHKITVQADGMALRRCQEFHKRLV